MDRVGEEGEGAKGLGKKKVTNISLAFLETLFFSNM